MLSICNQMTKMFHMKWRYSNCTTCSVCCRILCLDRTCISVVSCLLPELYYRWAVQSLVKLVALLCDETGIWKSVLALIASGFLSSNFFYSVFIFPFCLLFFFQPRPLHVFLEHSMSLSSPNSVLGPKLPRSIWRVRIRTIYLKVACVCVCVFGRGGRWFL